MAEVIRAVEEVFVEKGNGRVEMPPKPGIHPLPDAFIHAMPAYIPKMGAAGMKWVSGFPQNMSKKLPYISGLLILNDPQTGVPISVMDCTWITAKRTGAPRRSPPNTARANSVTVAILGCGVQGQQHRGAEGGFPRLAPRRPMISTRRSRKPFVPTPGKVEPRSGCLHKSKGRMPWRRHHRYRHLPSSKSIARDRASVASGRRFSFTVISTLSETRSVRGGAKFSPTISPNSSITRKSATSARARSGRRSGRVAGGEKEEAVRSGELIISVNLGIALEDMATAILVYRAARKKALANRCPCKD